MNERAKQLMQEAGECWLTRLYYSNHGERAGSPAHEEQVSELRILNSQIFGTERADLSSKCTLRLDVQGGGITNKSSYRRLAATTEKPTKAIHSETIVENQEKPQ
ncbi:hypothetical protein CDAR_561571 [Caerostris darwini]|uniref:Uncharacterized protein n=1 Tax=Caerostris darwini TaxID=1538125 RepID=A0AAV4ML38_9ARAC|nr:hypothetical protein CDAR_561571 [Caerostris darwini]